MLMNIHEVISIQRTVWTWLCSRSATREGFWNVDTLLTSTHRIRKESFWLFKKTQRKISDNTFFALRRAISFGSLGVPKNVGRIQLTNAHDSFH